MSARALAAAAAAALLAAAAAAAAEQTEPKPALYPGPAPLACRRGDGAAMRNVEAATWHVRRDDDLQASIDAFCAAERILPAACAGLRPTLRRSAYVAFGQVAAFEAARARVLAERALEGTAPDAEESLEEMAVAMRAYAMPAADNASLEHEYAVWIDRTVDVPLALDGAELVLAVGPEDDPAAVAAAVCADHGLADCGPLAAYLAASLPGLVCGGGGAADGADEKAARDDAGWWRAQDPPARRCERVFVDLGSWRGDSLRKFADPLYVHANRDRLGLSQWLTANVGASAESRKAYCMVGFEGNAVFAANLTALGAELAADGYAARVYTETVVGGVDGRARFFIDKSSGQYWGSSLRMEHPDVLRTTADESEDHLVRSAKLSTVLSTMLLDRGDAKDADLKGRVGIVKMDIEGAEYAILEDLLASGVACDLARRGADLHILLETHPYMEPFFLPGSPKGAGDALVYVLRRCGVHVVTAEHVTD